MPNHPILEHLYAALHAEVGVTLSTTGDPASLIARIYQVRRDACDPTLDALTVTKSPTTPNEVWIMKKASP